MTVLWILELVPTSVGVPALVHHLLGPRVLAIPLQALQAYVEPFVILTILILNAIIAIWQDSGFFLELG